MIRSISFNYGLRGNKAQEKRTRVQAGIKDSKTCVLVCLCLIKTEAYLFCCSWFCNFKHLVNIFKALINLLRHSLIFIFFIILRLFFIRLCIIYYILCLTFVINSPIPITIVVLKLWFIFLLNVLIISIYLWASTCDRDYKFHGSDRFLRTYWTLRYGGSFDVDESTDRVVRFYEIMRYDRNVYVPLTLFFIFACLVQFT